MDDYGNFLMEQNEEIWKPRLSTRSDAKKSDWARKYGDCHAIIEGEEAVDVGAPYPEHDHVSSSVSYP
jgi:hypothetical protein